MNCHRLCTSITARLISSSLPLYLGLLVSTTALRHNRTHVTLFNQHQSRHSGKLDLTHDNTSSPERSEMNVSVLSKHLGVVVPSRAHEDTIGLIERVSAIS